MTATSTLLARTTTGSGPSFARVVHAEWTKLLGLRSTSVTAVATVAVVTRLDERNPEVRTLGLRRNNEATNSKRARHGQLRSSSHLPSTSGDTIRCRRP